MRIGVSHDALPVPTHDMSTTNPHLSNTLDLQLQVFAELDKHGAKVYRIPQQFAPHLSDLSRPNYWGQIMESRAELQNWGSFVRANGYRIVAKLPERMRERSGQFRIAFNTDDNNEFRKIVFWLEGMYELFEVAQLPSDCRIIINAGRKVETATWSKKMVRKRLKQLPVPLLSRLAITSDVILNPEECMELGYDYGIPVAFNLEHGFPPVLNKTETLEEPVLCLLSVERDDLVQDLPNVHSVLAGRDMDLLLLGNRRKQGALTICRTFNNCS